jgi:hypothetical protein
MLARHLNRQQKKKKKKRSTSAASQLLPVELAVSKLVELRISHGVVGRTPDRTAAGF